MEATKKKPKGKVWRVIATAFKEFWLPLCAAIGLAIWGVSGDQLKAVQGYFFGFLMLAWFTGQIVRIQREIERKDSTNETLSRLTAISEKLEAQVQAFIGHSTGGDSYSKIHALVRGDNGDVDFAIAVTGQYPVRDVDVLSQDLEVDPPYSTARHGHHEVIWPNSLRQETTWLSDGRPRGRYLMQVSAFNHSTTCEAVVERGVDGSFVLACRQRVNNLPWMYQIPENFPGYEVGTPEKLFRHELPEGMWPTGRTQDV